MQQFRKLFQTIKRTYDHQPSRPIGLICKTGFYTGCPVLKLQKAAWTNDPMRQARNTSGIFFSIWLDKKGLAQNRIHYNIHALKLRTLKGYTLTSIAFAKNFRQAFAPQQNAWPNLSTAHGPQTLMQGHIEINPNTFPADILTLLNRFAAVTHIIDDLLSLHLKRLKSPGPGGPP